MLKLKMYDIIKHETAEILSDIEDSDGLLFGSPTIVNELLPPVRMLLANLNPVIHGKKICCCIWIIRMEWRSCS